MIERTLEVPITISDYICRITGSPPWLLDLNIECKMENEGLNETL